MSSGWLSYGLLEKSAVAYDEGKHHRDPHGQYTGGGKPPDAATSRAASAQAFEARWTDAKGGRAWNTARSAVPGGSGRSSVSWQSLGSKIAELNPDTTADGKRSAPAGGHYARLSFDQQIPKAVGKKGHKELMGSLKDLIAGDRKGAILRAHERGMIPEGTHPAHVHRAYEHAALHSLHDFGVGVVDSHMDAELQTHMRPLIPAMRFFRRRISMQANFEHKGEWRPYRKEFGVPFADNRRNKFGPDTGQVRLRVPPRQELVKVMRAARGDELCKFLPLLMAGAGLLADTASVWAPRLAAWGASVLGGAGEAAAGIGARVAAAAPGVASAVGDIAGSAGTAARAFGTRAAAAAPGVASTVGNAASAAGSAARAFGTRAAAAAPGMVSNAASTVGNAARAAASAVPGVASRVGAGVKAGWQAGGAAVHMGEPLSPAVGFAQKAKRTLGTAFNAATMMGETAGARVGGVIGGAAGLGPAGIARAATIGRYAGQVGEGAASVSGLYAGKGQGSGQPPVTNSVGATIAPAHSAAQAGIGGYGAIRRVSSASAALGKRAYDGAIAPGVLALLPPGLHGMLHEDEPGQGKIEAHARHPGAAPDIAHLMDELHAALKSPHAQRIVQGAVQAKQRQRHHNTSMVRDSRQSLAHLAR